jgi:uncharacterized membrane protein YphA (DoxX/SURF4 family)
MRYILTNRYYQLILRLTLGFIFIFAAMEKLTDLQGFSDSIINYRLFPIYLVNILAVIIPWIELFAGILLITGKSSREDAFIIFTLLTFFSLLIMLTMIRGISISCGCFGAHDATQTGMSKLLENFVFLMLSLQIIFFSNE